MVDDSNESVFQLIQQFAVSCNLPTHNNNCTCGREKNDCQNSSLASDLASAGRFGIPVSLFVEGQVEPLDPLSVLNVCDCLVILTDDVSNPSFFYVFTTCSINGFVTE